MWSRVWGVGCRVKGSPRVAHTGGRGVLEGSERERQREGGRERESARERDGGNPVSHIQVAVVF